VPEVTVVVGAVGGVGTSTLAALLARRRAAEGGRVVLVDLDGAHGGVEVLLGVERTAGARWPDLAQVRGTLAPGDLDGLLPEWRGVEVLSAGRSGGADDEAVAAVVRGLLASGREVVADLSARELRPESALADLLEHGLLGDGWALLVTGQDVLGVAAAVGPREVLGARARLVLRRRARARVAPAEAARALDVPLLAMVPTDRGVAEATDRGLGPVTGRWSGLSRAVGRIVRAVP
jgi:hypothetical protein